MNTRRIAFIITGLAGSGAETMLFNLLSNMSRRRFKPVVISLMDKGRWGAPLEALGVPVFPLGMMEGRVSPAAFVKLIGLTRLIRPDLIQGWMYHGNLAALAIKHLAPGKPPVLWCVQNSFLSFAAEKSLTAGVIRATAYLSGSALKIVYVSHVSRQQHEALGYMPNRGCVIPNAIDPSIMKPSDQARRALRAELGLPAHAWLVGMLARYHPQKDHANYVQAAKLLAREYHHVHFVLAGAGVDSGNEALCQQINEAGLDGRAHLLGERRDVAQLTAALDIATLSSSYGEGLSLAIAEAMACGVPCVVTDVGDSRMLVGDTGVVVPPQAPQELANGWARLIELGDAGRRIWGQAARERVLQNYSIESIARQYEDLYHSV